MCENAYLSIKNPKASRARLRALDPGRRMLALYVGNFRPQKLGPPLTKSWIHTCDSILFGYRLCGVILVRQIYTLEIILPIELRVTQNDTLAAYEPCNRTVTLVGELCRYKLVIFSVTQMWLLHLSLINDFSLDKKKYLRMVRKFQILFPKWNSARINQDLPSLIYLIFDERFSRLNNVEIAAKTIEISARICWILFHRKPFSSCFRSGQNCLVHPRYIDFKNIDWKFFLANDFEFWEEAMKNRVNRSVTGYCAASHTDEILKSSNVPRMRDGVVFLCAPVFLVHKGTYTNGVPVFPKCHWIQRNSGNLINYWSINWAQF